MEPRRRLGVQRLVAIAVLATMAIGSLTDVGALVYYRVWHQGIWGFRRLRDLVGWEVGDPTDWPVDAETMGHLVTWSLVGLVAAELTSGFRQRWLTIGALLALSAAFELLQPVLTDTRSAQWSDIAANAAGLVAAALAVTVARTSGAASPAEYSPDGR